MQTLLLSALLGLIFAPCFSEEWSDYRCVIETKVIAGGIEFKSISTMAALKKDSEIWFRITQLEPEASAFTTVIRGKERKTWFPKLDQTVTALDKELGDLSFIQDLKNALFVNPLAAAECKTAKLSNILKNFPRELDSLEFCRRKNGDGEINQVSLFDSLGIPIGVLRLLYGVHEAKGKTFLMPDSLSFKNDDDTVGFTAAYKAYRFDEGIPDATFYLKNEK